jgi:hypothetical protein
LNHGNAFRGCRPQELGCSLFILALAFFEYDAWRQDEPVEHPPLALLLHDAMIFSIDSAAIAKLNDEARQSFRGCRVVITQGINQLEPQAIADITAAVQQFSDFTRDNDPYEEHDFGKVDVRGHVVFWKFNYYDLDLLMHSPDAADPAVTARVLTIMLAEEY